MNFWKLSNSTNSRPLLLNKKIEYLTFRTRILPISIPLNPVEERIYKQTFHRIEYRVNEGESIDRQYNKVKRSLESVKWTVRGVHAVQSRMLSDGIVVRGILRTVGFKESR